MPDPKSAPTLPVDLLSLNHSLTEAEISDLRELISKHSPSTESELAAIVMKWVISRTLRLVFGPLLTDPEKLRMLIDASGKAGIMKRHTGGIWTSSQGTTLSSDRPRSNEFVLPASTAARLLSRPQGSE